MSVAKISTFWKMANLKRCINVSLLSSGIPFDREELTAFEKNGVLTKLLVSFSRDVPVRGPGDAETPKYVQDNIRIWGNDLCDLIYNSGAFIYVCG